MPFIQNSLGILYDINSVHVPRGRIELPTQGFSVLCSTTELPRHVDDAGLAMSSDMASRRMTGRTKAFSKQQLRGRCWTRTSDIFFVREAL